MDTFIDIALVSVVAVAVFSNLYALPGNLFIALSSLFYGLSTNFAQYSFTLVLTLFIFALVLEALEFFLIAFTSRKYGTSKWGIVGAFAGGLIGALTGLFFSPVFGALIGSLIGLFIGACAIELLKNKTLRSSLYAGLGVFLGRIGGLSIKSVGAVTMASMVLSKVI